MCVCCEMFARGLESVVDDESSDCPVVSSTVAAFATVDFLTASDWE